MGEGSVNIGRDAIGNQIVTGEETSSASPASGSPYRRPRASTSGRSWPNCE